MALQRKAIRKRGLNTHNKASIVKGGRPFFDCLLRQIAGAKNSIHLQTYIFTADTTGNEVADALMTAARRGVSVHLMADGYASQDLPPKFIQTLESAGVCFRFFEPLFRSEHFYFGRRLHHKVAVFDNTCALVSGSNIADRYNDLPDDPPWFDMAVLVEGAAAIELYDICGKIWEKDRSKKNKLRRKLASIFNHIAQEEAVGVKVLQNDWVRRKHEIYFAYHKLFKEARKEITIVCSYFLPGLSLRNRLVKAVKRGVVVRVVLAATSDIKVTKHAERYLYRWMLRNGIQIYEYKPTILHAKVAVVDEELLTVGSYNLNELSALASVELNLLVKDRELALELKKEIDDVIERDCLHIHQGSYRTRLFSVRQLWQFLCFQSLRLLIALGTFYYKQEE